MFVRRLSAATLVVAVFLCLADNASGEAIDVELIAERVAQGVGQVSKTSASGKLGPIFIFEENHTSRVGQHQIAVMLSRLYLQYDLRRIGVEGSAKPGALDASWFNQLGGNAWLSARQDVAVRMLGEGEISAAELMTMVYPAIEVFGVEKQAEYDVPFPKGNPTIKYLIAIKKTMIQEHVTNSDRLIEQKKIVGALKELMNSDPWVQKYYEQVISYSPKTSVESTTKVLRDIEGKAREVSASIDADTKREMGEMLKGWDTASQRSVTMARRTLEIPKPGPDAPVALIIGAAHTDGVLQEINRQGARYALLTPLALEYGDMDSDQYDRKSNGYWARTSPGTLGALLNPKHKPAPIIENPSAHSYASMKMAAIIVAEAARAGRKVPEDVWAELAALPDITIDSKSFYRDGLDVLFSARLKTLGGGERAVWTRVGTVANAEEGRTLEQKLLQNVADLSGEIQPDPGGGGSQIPPHEPPQGGIVLEDEGPGDFRKKGEKDGKEGRKATIERLNRDTLVVHGDKTTIDEIGRISG